MLNTSGFDSRLIEKIYRISDILQKLYTTGYTKKRLSLYGGTALNFIHFKDIPRLSIDIDFNYRDQQQNNWDQERNEIGTIIKKILHDLHYDKTTPSQFNHRIHWPDSTLGTRPRMAEKIP